MNGRENGNLICCFYFEVSQENYRKKVCLLSEKIQFFHMEGNKSYFIGNEQVPCLFISKLEND